VVKAVGDKISKKFLGYIGLIRPFTLLAPLIVSTCIMVASYVVNNNGFTGIWSSIWYIVLPASLSLTLLNAASNALNQITDIESDRISKPYRPLPKGLLTVFQAFIASIIFYITSIIIAWFINIKFFSLVLLIVFFTITYSLPPRFKKMLFLNQIWVAIPRGFLGILAGWSVFGSPIQPIPLIGATISFFFMIGGCVTKDITDSYADSITGTKTLINTYGLEKTSFMVFPFLFTPFLIIPITIDVGILNTIFWPLTLLVIPGFFIFYLMFRNQNISSRLENTLAWSLMYITYFLFAFSFSILSIIQVVIL